MFFCSNWNEKLTLRSNLLKFLCQVSILKSKKIALAIKDLRFHRFDLNLNKLKLDFEIKLNKFKYKLIELCLPCLDLFLILFHFLTLSEPSKTSRMTLLRETFKQKMIVMS